MKLASLTKSLTLLGEAYERLRQAALCSSSYYTITSVLCEDAERAVTAAIEQVTRDLRAGEWK